MMHYHQQTMILQKGKIHERRLVKAGLAVHPSPSLRWSPQQIFHFFTNGFFTFAVKLTTKGQTKAHWSQWEHFQGLQWALDLALSDLPGSHVKLVPEFSVPGSVQQITLCHQSPWLANAIRGHMHKFTRCQGNCWE